MAGRRFLVDTTRRPARTNEVETTRSSSSPGPFDEATKGQVYRRWRSGASVDLLAAQFALTVAVIERAVNEIRARCLLEQKLEFVHNPCFDDPVAAARIRAPMPTMSGTGKGQSKSKPPAGTPPYLAGLYSIESPLLNREQEAHLFRKMNYLKFQAGRLRDQLHPMQVRSSDLDQIERLLEEAQALKDQIIRANLRLVVAVVRSRVGSANNFFELVSDGNLSLIRAVEKFDFSRGFKFSTYATWTILNNIARNFSEECRRRHRFTTGSEELYTAPDHRTCEPEFESDQRRNHEAVHGMLGKLNDRERQILAGRFGIGGANKLTLEQLGKVLGITKERVRQIEVRAKQKLLKFARELKIDAHAI